MSDVTSFHVTGDWRHIIDDGMVDLDALPDEALPTGKVEFTPIWPTLAVAGTPTVGYTLAPVTALIAAGQLRDLQGREGVWLAGQIGEHTVQWRATVYLEFQKRALHHPSVEFELTTDMRLSGIIDQTGPGLTPVILDPRIEALAQRVDEVAQAVSDAQGHAQDAQDAADSFGVTVGSSTGTPGAPAAVTITGDGPSYHIDFTVPKGEKGDKGDPGDVSLSQLNAAVGPIADEIETGRLSEAELNATYANRRLAGAARPSKAHGVTVTDHTGTPQVLDLVDGILYGAVGTTLYASTDDGYTWTHVATLPYEPLRLVPCDDGEVLLVSMKHIHKSSGWAASRWSATWTHKITTAFDSALFYRFGFDGNGTKFIAAEYTPTRVDSRYVHISLDGGNTWNVVWDTAAEFPETHAESHLHAMCYDPWQDRFWLFEGHGTPRGCYYSDDDGATWTRLNGGYAESLTAMPMAALATPDGIVCGTDDGPNGIMAIRRADDANLALEVVWQRFEAKGMAYGLCERMFLDEATGLVYLAYRSEYAETRAYIAAGTTASGGLVWDSGIKELSARVSNVVVTPSGRLLATYVSNVEGTKAIRGWVGPAGAPSNENTGNILGGAVTEGTSTAVGLEANAAGNNSLVVGVKATTSSNYATAVGVEAASGGNGLAVGYQAKVTSVDQGVAVGATSLSSGARAIAVGYGAQATGTDAVAMGRNSSATGTETVAVGGRAEAAAGNTAFGGQAKAVTGTNTVAIGAQAVASANWAVAIGRTAVASHVGSVALGGNSASTADNQVAVGNKHFEFGEVYTLPTAPGADKARLFARDLDGKTQLCVRFPTGGVQVVAVEP